MPPTGASAIVWCAAAAAAAGHLSVDLAHNVTRSHEARVFPWDLAVDNR